MNDKRTLKIARLVNRIFILTGNNSNDDLAYMYAKELEETKKEIIPKQLKEYVINNHKSYSTPSLRLFLEALDSITERKVDKAWKTVIEILPYMKETTTYKSNDKYLLYAINEIGISYIIQSQQFVDTYTNKINPYQLNDIKKQFYKYYNYAKNNNLGIKQIGNGIRTKNIITNIPKKLIEIAQNQSILNENKINANNIAKQIKNDYVANLIELGRSKNE